MLRNLFGSQTKRRPSPARAPKLDCELLGDRVVPAVLVNEVMVNPPTSTDAPHEYIELRVEAGTSLTGYYVAAVEGEVPGSGGANPGTIDLLIDLEQYQSAYNAKFGAGNAGLILLTATGSGYTGTANALVINRAEFGNTSNPGIENGSTSFITFTSDGSVIGSEADAGFDLDADGTGGVGNGTLDAVAGITYVDGVGFQETSGGSDYVYGFDVTPSNSKDPDYIVRYSGNTTAYFEDGAYSGTSNTWSAAEIANTRNANGDYKIDEVTFGNGITTSDYTTAGSGNL